MKEKTVRFTVAITEPESVTLKRIAEATPLMKLGVDRNTMIRYIIISYEEMQKKVAELETKIETTTREAMLASRGVAGKPFKEPALSYAEKKEKAEEEKRARGIGLCEALEGRLDGDVCVFKKYEITAVGYVVDSMVTENIYNLSEKTLDDQYYPSRAEWEAAKEADDAAEAAKRAG